MQFTPTPLAGVFIIDPDVFDDPRGAFVCAWSADAFRAHGLELAIAQCSLSENLRRGTLRGLHFQTPPHQSAKTIRVTRGAIFDVAVDLRANSPTFCQWTAIELTSTNRRSLHIPAGCAHGYQTLENDSEMMYFGSAAYAPHHQGGVRWDDPAFGVAWPIAPTVINDRDRSYADFTARHP